ncbi:winged helix-turn-helix domain-containing protein [Vibrio sp. SCSIO 43137]|uniref:winged helix-turn-helix domain-containing protein n=1 Tax=Vibrio sp. SCSIO 43137 TaxID=3021011 RepID=UPI002307257D|nr:winged helix-turn-helix domain-containing protein [Vibrio sp. SCSIO 43137]WCE28494.1 winged helix-turn-helix domain-containing protein [Vibrio sp. SCSIO 43137]
MFNKKYLINENHLFDPERKTISVQYEDKRDIILGNNESDIFLTLIERRPEVLSKEDLVELVWEDKGSAVYGSSVVQSISTLRKTLNDSTKSPLFIRTVPRKGYQFVGIISDIIEEKPIVEPVINAEETTSTVNIQAPTKFTTASNNKLPLIVLAMLSFCICGYLLYSSKQQTKPTDLISVGDYKGIPVFSFGQNPEKGVEAI